MFCKNCGTEIEEKTKFCPVCGCAAADSQGHIEKSTLIKTFGASKKVKNAVKLYYGMAVLFGIFGVICIGTSADVIGTWFDYGGRWVSESDKLMVFAGVLAIIYCPLAIVYAKSGSQRRVSVYTDKIIGVISTGLLPKTFEISYTDVLSVSYASFKQGVIIESAKGTLNCYQIESPQECTDLIQSKL